MINHCLPEIFKVLLPILSMKKKSNTKIMAFRLLFVLYPFNIVEQKILPWAWLSYEVYLLCGKASFLSPITKSSPNHKKPGREGKMPVLYLRH